MKSKIAKILAAILAVSILYIFFNILTIYTEPLNSFSLDLSLSPHEEGFFEQNFDQKGWTVYTQNESQKAALIPNGYGGYSGIEPGQTFYFSRTLTEKIDSPMLKLGGEGDIAYAVFLDDVLLYTDYPELDSRIGYFTLPSGELWHNEPITLSLPPDYLGKTLTIAQSAPMVSDAGSLLVIPANVYLYCGYAYESELIAESFNVAIIATLAFVIGIILLFIFVRTPDFGTIFLALSFFLWMSLSLMQTSFFHSYFGAPAYDAGGFIRSVIAGSLLFFLCSRGGRFRKLSYILPGIYIASLAYIYVTVKTAYQTGNSVSLTSILSIPEQIFCAELLIIMILGVVLWFKESYFYKLFLPGIFLINIMYWTFLGIKEPMAFSKLSDALSAGSVTYLYYRILPLFTIAAVIAVFSEALKKEFTRRTEKHLLEERQDLIHKSYENLKLQHQEVMMLRHDMNRHFQLLYEISETAQAKEYLEELIGQNKKIRPVISSGNEILDIILNGKLGSAKNAGIEVEIEKAEAPEKLPLSDNDLCSLIMNILDNAITAASGSKLEHPYLRLNIHVKNNFLSILCENSAAAEQSKKTLRSSSLQKHGLGIKIIKTITDRYEGIYDTESGKDSYKLQIAIPLT